MLFVIGWKFMQFLATLYVFSSVIGHLCVASLTAVHLTLDCSHVNLLVATVVSGGIKLFGASSAAVDRLVNIRHKVVFNAVTIGTISAA